jgi:hypothetical protein
MLSIRKLSGTGDVAYRRAIALRQPGVPSMFDSLEVKVLYPT